MTYGDVVSKNTGRANRIPLLDEITVSMGLLELNGYPLYSYSYEPCR